MIMGMITSIPIPHAYPASSSAQMGGCALNSNVHQHE